MDTKTEASMMERIGQLADFRLVMRALKLDSEFQYLFVLSKDTDNSFGNQWTGELNEIKK